MSGQIGTMKPTKHAGVATSGKAITSLVLGILSFGCSFVTGILALIFGFLAINDIGKSRGKLQGQPLAIAGIITGVVGTLLNTALALLLLLPAVHQVRAAARQAQQMNDMRQLLLAMHNHESVFARFPIAMPLDNSELEPQKFPATKLSWRVQLLPYIDQLPLYEKFNHEEPWDSPHNIELVDQMPPIFGSLSHELEPGRTMILVPYSNSDVESERQDQAVFLTGRTPRFADIMDGTSNTILLLEVDPEAAVIWTKPDEWHYDPSNPMRDLGNARPGIILVGMADGSVARLEKNMDIEKFKAMITARKGDIAF